MSVVQFVSLIALAFASPALGQAERAMLDEAQAADAAMMAAQSRGDLETMANMIADDYAYIDLDGNRADKAKVLSRREGDKLSMSEMTDSENEAIALSPGVVMLRGKTEGTAYYFGGLPRTGATRWSAIWRKDGDGRWRVVSEQTTVVKQKQVDPPTVTQPPQTLIKRSGTWRLSTRTPMNLTLRAEAGRLKASIPEQFTDMEFIPSGSDTYFNTLRPFELRFAPDGQSLTFVTWGSETLGSRLSDSVGVTKRITGD